ncbi:PHP domain-containing protein [Methanorbis rubei]|uniref:Polymerase/histidinol phosphatase N-terminal domain-containing protein n=1 Tax=Methanorbis rubei TaxID=3028300 RepID=A0AAE4SCD5_9EURY|nr:hypothetical protein [Methanocorpusculaceae archaeon Cs1]
MSGSVQHASACPIVFNDGSAFDMHVHTNHSDGFVRIPELLAYLRRRNLCAAITDHNVITGVCEAYEHEDAGNLIIPGIEVSAVDGPHMLIYFDTVRDLQSYYESSVHDHQGACPHMATDLTTEQIVIEANESGGFVVAAHPYGYAMLVRGALKAIDVGIVSPIILDSIDGLEVICGGLSHSLNTRAEAYAALNNFCMTGGSDAHTLREVGRAVTVADEVLPVEEFLEAVRLQRTDVIGCERGPVNNLLMGTQVLAKYVPYLGPGLAVHLRQGKMRLRK